MAGRQFVYRYDGDAASDEVELDLQEETPIPEQNQVLKRKGNRWKVASIQIEQTASHPPALPVYRIFLTKIS
jgi:hypothetical protein